MRGKFAWLKNCGGKQKSRGVLFTLFCLLGLQATQPALAQDKEQIWKNIIQADEQVAKVKLIWQYNAGRPGDANPLSEEDYEKEAFKLKAKGKSEKETQSYIAALREGDAMDSSGFTVTGTLTTWRVDKQMRCDLLSTVPQIKGQKKSTEMTRSIDYFDGTNVVTIANTSALKGKSATTETPQVGEINNKKEDALYRTAAHFASRIFLLHAPVSNYFSENDYVGEGDNNTVILEKKLTDRPDRTVRAFISKDSWRPLKIEQVKTGRKEPDATFVGSKFKKSGEGFLMPTQVDIQFITKTEYHYTLQESAFNKQVNDSELAIGGTPTINDCRFGDCVAYKWESGTLPSKEKVEKIRASKVDLPPSFNQPSGNIPMALPILGLSLICLGGGMLRVESRRSKKKSDK